MSRPLLYSRVTELTVLAAFFGGLVSLVHEMPWLENALDLEVGAAASLVLAGALLLLIYPTGLLKHAGPVDQWAVWALLTIGLVSGSMAGVSYANRKHAVPLPSERWTVAEKWHQSPASRSGERWKLRLTSSGESHWIYVTRADWNAIAQGQTYEPIVLAGRLQLRFVEPPLR